MSRRLLQIVWPFLTVVVLLVALNTVSTRIMSSVRAYVGAESLWSKAQKESVAALSRYARTQADADFDRYQVAIAVPIGDRIAREELDKSEPNYAVARKGFLDGRNNPDDIGGMIALFRYFRHVNYIERAIGIWAKADVEIEQLQQAAQYLRAQILGGTRDPTALRPTVDEINAINARLTPLEDAFSSTLGEASRRTQLLLEGVTLVEFDDGTTATVKAGEHIVVEAGRVHNVRADPAGPARAIAVWLVEKGKPLVEAAS